MSRPGPVYRSAATYGLVMRALYAGAWRERYAAVAEWVEPGEAVVDLCCGPPTLWERHLRAKGVEYVGVDVNPAFVDRVRRSGGVGVERDLRRDPSWPPADVVILQGSLYHFLPDAETLLGAMVASARRLAVVAEPVRNLTAASRRWAPRLARWADPGTGPPERRFDEAGLRALVAPWQERIVALRPIARRRELLIVLRGGAEAVA